MEIYLKGRFRVRKVSSRSGRKGFFSSLISDDEDGDSMERSMTRGCTTSGKPTSDPLPPSFSALHFQSTTGRPAEFGPQQRCSKDPGTRLLSSSVLSVLVHFQRESCINEDSKCVPAFHSYREAEVLLLYELLFGVLLHKVCRTKNFSPLGLSWRRFWAGSRVT